MMNLLASDREHSLSTQHKKKQDSLLSSLLNLARSDRGTVARCSVVAAVCFWQSRNQTEAETETEEGWGLTGSGGGYQPTKVYVFFEKYPLIFFF